MCFFARGAYVFYLVAVVNKRRNQINEIESETANAIFNSSSRKLSEIEERVLSKGLKYGIKNKRVDTYELMSRFEELAQSLSKLKIAEKNDELKANLNTKSALFQQLQNMSTEFIELSKKAMDNLSEEEHAALTELAKDKSIVITKADKGNAVVIQDVSDYKLKVSKVLDDSNKFRKLTHDVTISRERKLVSLLREMNATFKYIPDRRVKKVLIQDGEK